MTPSNTWEINLCSYKSTQTATIICPLSRAIQLWAPVQMPSLTPLPQHEHTN